jgi:pyruvate dehydrogenase E2 component (dihydrolipoyllysine-residue acetyltransferase)
MTRPAVALLATGLLTCSIGPSTARAAAQTPPVEAPKPAPTPAPAAPKPAPSQAPATPRPRTPASSAATLTLSVKVTDSTGAPMVGTKVAANGPVVRASVTDATGTVRFIAMRAGTYRLRFESPTTITLERDVVLRAGPGEPIEVSLNPAPPPPPPPAPEPPKDPIASRGPLQAPAPRTVAIPEFVERNAMSSREPSKTSQLACGATSTTNLVQIREPLKDVTHTDAEALIYVVGGEGLLAMPIADVPLAAGTFSLVPRGTTYTLQRRGRNALIVLMTLTDTVCQK